MRSPETDFTAKALIEGLPAGQDIFYRVRFEDHAFPTVMSEPLIGRFRTAPNERRSVSFVWSGDTAGQGWGIDEARGGMRTYATMLRQRPDFFIHSRRPHLCRLPDQRGAEAAERRNLEEHRDRREIRTSRTRSPISAATTNTICSIANVRAFNADVPMFAQWDDHEVTNDWCPGEPPRRERYARPRASCSSRRAAARAFHEFMPMRETLAEAGRVYRKIAYGPLLDVFMLDMRSYRRPTSDRTATPTPAPSSGRRRLAWLKRELMSSQRHLEGDSPPICRSAWSATMRSRKATGRRAAARCEIADLLAFIKHAGIRNTVWLTADMHYTAAHYYDPNVAVFQEFEPFWEFISGPLHAGTWSPQPLDNTFGPRAVFPEGLQRRAAGQSRALLRLAVLRSRDDRWLDRGDDRDAQGRGRQRPLVDHDRAAAGAMVGPRKRLTRG